MARELEQAAEIQRRFLPSAAPKLAGIELAGHNAAWWCAGVGIRSRGRNTTTARKWAIS
jgi:hypothetical protein